jgi:hypothetical protein
MHAMGATKPMWHSSAPLLKGSTSICRRLSGIPGGIIYWPLQEGPLDPIALWLGQGLRVATPITPWCSATMWMPAKSYSWLQFSWDQHAHNETVSSGSHAIWKGQRKTPSPHSKVHPKYGDCFMYKVDIVSGGFCRVPLSPLGVLKLGVCLKLAHNLYNLRVCFSTGSYGCIHLWAYFWPNPSMDTVDQNFVQQWSPNTNTSITH